MLIACWLSLNCYAQEIELTPGLVITRSVKIKPGTYRLSARDTTEQGSIITIEGSNLTVDFNGAVLWGSAEQPTPDQYFGYGIVVKKGSNVTIKNAVVRGFKVGLIARDVDKLTITHGNFSYNWKQHLLSNLEKEDVTDWMSYHQNEKDEWLRYGAAMYLKNCSGAQVDNTTVTGGQNALLLTQCNDGLFYNNSFSFNSSLGIGMYRSSRNRIMHNRLDWNVRGYSHGVYQRGQDSAAILVYEQSSDNTFAYNSATHSGDGFFLWAGQTTMDTGEGGCNDNLLYGNDFSYAPTNGVEVTFSRNKIVKNRIEECTHGIWGGYSFNTLIARNQFLNNQTAIAIEHGQDNEIIQNAFDENKVAIHLWGRKEQPKHWGYAQKRDTRSRNYSISGNKFSSEKQGKALELQRSENITIILNSFTSVPELIQADSTVKKVAFRNNNVFKNQLDIALPASVAVGNNYWEVTNEVPRKYKKAKQPLNFGKAFDVDFFVSLTPERLPDGTYETLQATEPRGRQYILVDEWGPYDFRSPAIWLREQTPDGKLTFEILGPKGKWKIWKWSGFEKMGAETGNVPGDLHATLLKDSTINVEVEMEYVGDEVVSPFGIRTAKGQPYTFRYRHFRVPTPWTVSYFQYNGQTDPQKHYEAFKLLLATKPIKTETKSDLAYQWYGTIGPGLPGDSIGTLAETQITVPAGNYEIGLTSDDGARLWVDDKLVLDDWQPHEAAQKSVVVKLGGKHHIRMEHYEVSGLSTLNFIFKPN